MAVDESSIEIATYSSKGARRQVPLDHLIAKAAVSHHTAHVGSAVVDRSVRAEACAEVAVLDDVPAGYPLQGDAAAHARSLAARRGLVRPRNA